MDEDEFISTQETDIKFEEIASQVGNSMWYGLMLGIAIGVCICGIIQHISLRRPEWANLINFSWEPWAFLLFILVIVFWIFEKRYKDSLKL